VEAGPAGQPARLGNRPTSVNGCPQRQRVSAKDGSTSLCGDGQVAVVSDGTGQEDEAGESETDGHDSHGGSRAEGGAEDACDHVRHPRAGQREEQREWPGPTRGGRARAVPNCRARAPALATPITPPTLMPEVRRPTPRLLPTSRRGRRPGWLGSWLHVRLLPIKAVRAMDRTRAPGGPCPSSRLEVP